MRRLSLPDFKTHIAAVVKLCGIDKRTDTKINGVK